MDRGALSRGGLTPGTIYLRCGNFAATDILDRRVHVVVTDPPFFRDIHYSDLATLSTFKTPQTDLVVVFEQPGGRLYIPFFRESS